MNTRTALSLLFAAMTVAAGPLCAETKSNSAIVHPVSAVERNSSSTIVRGSTSVEVYQALGAPARKLNADTWLYPGFNGDVEQAGDEHCNLLIVSFQNALVTELRLVNHRAEQVIAAQLRTQTTPGVLVARRN